MKKIYAVMLVLLVVGSISYFPEITIAKPSKIDAMKLYNKHCIDCHDKNGKPTDLGKELESIDFTDKNWQANVTDEKINKQITDGTPEKMMPFKEKLNQDEINALVPFVRNFVKK